MFIPKLADNPKPYFLEGLLHARSILEQLKKNKQQEIQLSPIRRKHTKFSNQTIIEDEEEPNQNSPIRQENNYMKQNHQHQRSHSSNFNFSKNEQYRSSFGRENAGDEIKKQIERYRININEIGKDLEEINKQIESYQIVFDHLCECYRANSAIVNKNHKLKRESLRLTEERAQIMGKIKDLDKQTEQIDVNTKKVNAFIQKNVEAYIRDILIYNKEEEVKPPKNITGQQRTQMEDKQSEEQEDYSRFMNLNFKQYKKEKEEFTQKKVLMEPRKLEKGISFEEDIDVISKYYQAQLSNI